MRWMRWIFVKIVLTAVNAVKINISPHFLHKFTTKFTAFLAKIHRNDFCGKLMYEMRWKRWMRWKEIIHHISPHFLQKFTAKFTSFLKKIHSIWFPKFIQSDLKSQEISMMYVTGGLEQWTKQLKACRRSEVRNRVGTILSCKNTENAVKINNSPQFTAKRCKKNAAKFFFSEFHRSSYENSPPNLDPIIHIIPETDVYAHVSVWTMLRTSTFNYQN